MTRKSSGNPLPVYPKYTDFGNSGFALIAAKDYISPEDMDYTGGEVILERGTNRLEITHDGKTFVITADGK